MLWSAARVAAVALRHWPGWTPERESALAAEVRGAAYEIIARKGATNHAIGLVTAALLKSALRDEHRVLTVSRVQDGALGIREVAISLPAAVGREGVTEIIEPEMSPDEKVALERSVEILRQAAAGL